MMFPESTAQRRHFLIFLFVAVIGFAGGMKVEAGLQKNVAEDNLGGLPPSFSATANPINLPLFSPSNADLIAADRQLSLENVLAHAQKQRIDRARLVAEFEAYYEQKRLYLEARFREQQLRERAFLFQRESQVPILWVVMFITISGVVLCFLQFRSADRIAAPMPYLNSGHTAPNPSDRGATTIDLSAKNLKLTTQAIGVAVLTLSLAFFYLYLTQVYRVSLVKSNITVQPAHLELPEVFVPAAH